MIIENENQSNYGFQNNGRHTSVVSATFGCGPSMALPSRCSNIGTSVVCEHSRRSDVRRSHSLGWKPRTRPPTKRTVGFLSAVPPSRTTQRTGRLMEPTLLRSVTVTAGAIEGDAAVHIGTLSCLRTARLMSPKVSFVLIN